MRFKSLVVARLVVVAATSALVTASPVGATKVPVTHKPSYTNLYSGSASDGNNTSPCTPSGCANGLKITWSAGGSCYQGDRYAPISVVFTVGGKVSTKAWPLTAPCSTGFEFSWSKYNNVDLAKWVGASSKAAHSGLAICFQSKTQCNAGHCVTAGCVPAKSTGVDVFFQGGDTPAAAEWLFNGKPDGSVTFSGAPDSLLWYGTTPPSSVYPSSPGTASGVPAVTITGRTSRGYPQIKTDTAPSNVNGVDMTWYLPKYEKGTSRGCHEFNGQWFTSPPLAFAYTTDGVLSSPVSLPQCGTSGGNPIPFSDLDFSWITTGSGINLTFTDPMNYVQHYTGCQGSYRSPGLYPTTTIPQPPAGANGLVFTFPHDDYSATCWTESRAFINKQLSHPGHSRFDVLRP